VLPGERVKSVLNPTLPFVSTDKKMTAYYLQAVSQIHWGERVRGKSALMDSKTKTGLIAAGIVIGSIAMLALAIVTVRSAKNRGKQQTTITVENSQGKAVFVLPSTPGGESETEDELVDKIIRHTFWRVKVTRSALLGITDQIRAKSANTLAYIDDGLHVGFHEGAYASGLRDTPFIVPEGVESRSIMIDLNHFSKRPSRHDILATMPALLDRRDFERPADYVPPKIKKVQSAPMKKA